MSRAERNRARGVIPHNPPFGMPRLELMVQWPALDPLNGIRVGPFFHTVKTAASRPSGPAAKTRQLDSGEAIPPVPSRTVTSVSTRPAATGRRSGSHHGWTRILATASGVASSGGRRHTPWSRSYQVLTLHV